jgi:hypothetical protein
MTFTKSHHLSALSIFAQGEHNLVFVCNRSFLTLEPDLKYLERHRCGARNVCSSWCFRGKQLIGDLK